MLHQLWRSLKRQRRLAMGPATLLLQFTRTSRVTRASGRLDHPAPGMAEQAFAAGSAPKVAPNRGGPERALLIGVGPGLGEALARLLVEAGFSVGLVARDGPRLDAFVRSLGERGGRCHVLPADVTHETSVDALFDQYQVRVGTPDLVVYGVQSFGPGAFSEIEVPAFEDSWRVNCFGAFLVGRRAVRAMLPHGRGTIVFVGSTSSLVGREGHLNLAAGKFGQRALAQVLSREVWSKGIHVAHLVIDADIREGDAEAHAQSEPVDIADAVLYLHRQPRSAWTSEMDLRPSNEAFWQHC